MRRRLPWALFHGFIQSTKHVFPISCSIVNKAQRVDPIAPETSRRMRVTIGADNAKERALRSALHRRGFRFRVHRKVLPESRRTADIVFVRIRVAVFLDGCFWHGCPIHGTQPKNNALWWKEKIAANKARDMDTAKRLSRLGWKVVRIWEHDSIERGVASIERACRNARKKFLSSVKNSVTETGRYETRAKGQSVRPTAPSKIA
jgi:DNA mismatch endonuclease (patch repair protein)